jgi:hypothetical protein
MQRGAGSKRQQPGQMQLKYAGTHNAGKSQTALFNQNPGNQFLRMDAQCRSTEQKPAGHGQPKNSIWQGSKET